MHVHTIIGEKMIADVSQTPDILISVLFQNMGYIKLKYNVGLGKTDSKGKKKRFATLQS